MVLPDEALVVDPGDGTADSHRDLAVTTAVLAVFTEVDVLPAQAHDFADAGSGCGKDVDHIQQVRRTRPGGELLFPGHRVVAGLVQRDGGP